MRALGPVYIASAWCFYAYLRRERYPPGSEAFTVLRTLKGFAVSRSKICCPPYDRLSTRATSPMLVPA